MPHCMWNEVSHLPRGSKEQAQIIMKSDVIFITNQALKTPGPLFHRSANQQKLALETTVDQLNPLQQV